MSQVTLTNTNLANATYSATLSGPPGDAPEVAILFRDVPLSGVEISPETPGVWVLRARIPEAALSDGIHVFLVIDNASGARLGDFAVIAGDGADDALRADHDPGELRARLSLRLQGAVRKNRKAARLVQLGLTPVEERIFRYMSRHTGEIVDRAALAQVLGEADWAYGDRRIDVHIARIRQKLESRSDGGFRVRSARGRGYILDDNDD